MKTQFKNVLTIISGICLLGATSFSFAAGPFNVTVADGQSLPTTIIAEGFSTAYYEVTNDSGGPLNNNFVKYLPQNVEQVTNDPAYCAEFFNLNNNASCILKLNVIGPVDKNDPDNDLYVCSAGGIFCTGVVDADALHVKVVTALAAGSYCNENCDEAPPHVAEYLTGFQPMLAQRAANGWAFPHLNEDDLPEDYFDFGQLHGVACADNFCMATGSYQDAGIGDVDPTTFPLMALSANGASDWVYQSYFSSTYFEIGNNYSTSCSDNLCISAGTACDIDSNQPVCTAKKQHAGKITIENPMLVYTTDGEDWGTVDIISLIDDITPSDRPKSDVEYLSPGALFATGCSDSNRKCVVGGTYYSSFFGTRVPLLLTLDTNLDPDTDDWEFQFDLLADADSFSHICSSGNSQCGSFYATSCSEVFCIAGGGTDLGGTTLFSNDFVLLAVQNQGDNNAWSYATDFMTDINASEAEGGIITAANCFDDLCVVGGQFNNSDAPILVLSPNGFNNTKNQVSNWTYIDLGFVPTGAHSPIEPQNVPDDYESIGQILSVSCDNNVCVAVGFYQVEDFGDVPLMLQSLDSGKSWAFIDIANFLPEDFNLSHLDAASCSNGICIAAGYYLAGRLDESAKNVLSGSKPLLVQSINGGPWTLMSELPEDFEDTGAFYGVNAPGTGDGSGNANVLFENMRDTSQHKRPAIL